MLLKLILKYVNMTDMLSNNLIFHVLFHRAVNFQYLDTLTSVTERY